MRKCNLRGGDSKAVGTSDSALPKSDSLANGLDAEKVVTTHKKDEKNVGGKEGFGMMAGGRKHRRSHRRHSRRMSKRVARKTQHRRGGMGNIRKTLTKAILPFGLWGAQRLMRRKKNRKTMKRMSKRVTSFL